MTDSLALILLPALLFASGFFSASETALFSLNRPDRTWLGERPGSAARCVLALLERPRALLVVVLFGNLLINFLLFALTAELLAGLADGESGVDLSERVFGDRATGQTVLLILGGLGTTGVVIVFGEIVPKSIAVTAPRQVALLTGPPLLLWRAVVSSLGLVRPLERTVGALVDRVERSLLPEPMGPLTDEELRELVELQGQEGLIERRASEFLAEALELRSRRVHEVMTPRVDLVACDATAGREELLALIREHRVGKVLVHDGGGLDQVRGYLRTREVLAYPDRPLTELIRSCWFVPTTKSLESLLREMIEREERLALVVGEYGGTEGLVTLEDVVEEITGDIARADARPLLEPVEGEAHWRMAGRFPLREVGELLGVGFPTGPTTLAGFVAHALGRIPEADDVFTHAGVSFHVEAVARRRATAVRLALPEATPTERLARVAAEPAEAPEPEPKFGSGDEHDVPPELTKSGALRARVRLARWHAESAPRDALDSDIGEALEEGGP